MIATWPRQFRLSRLQIVLLLVATLATACVHVQTSKTQAFKDLHRIDTDLVRGVSTRADVLALLGAPDGRGVWVYGTDSDPGGGARDIWVYMHSHFVVATKEQKRLLVFLKGNLYDGYFWSTEVLTRDVY